MNKSETITHLATALAKAQAEMPVAVFDATNPFLKSKYASLGSVIQASRPILAKHTQAQKIAFVVENDPCSIGIITALEEAGKAGNAIMETQGVQKDTQPLIRGGASPVKAGVAYFPENYGAQGVPKLLEIISQVRKGVPLAEAYKAVVKDSSIQFVVDNQNYTEPAVYVKTQVLTPATIDKFYPAAK